LGSISRGGFKPTKYRANAHGLANAVATLSGLSNIQIEEDIAFDGRRYWAAIIPLSDAGNRVVGHLVMLRDMTPRLTEFKNHLFVFIGIALAISICVLLVFFMVLNGTELQLVTAEQNLLKESHEKLHMQSDFIERLQLKQAQLAESEERFASY